MRRLQTVCLGCEKREVGCHGHCEAYLAAKAEWDAKQDMIRQAKLSQGDIIQLKKEGVARMRKRRRSSGKVGGEQ